MKNKKLKIFIKNGKTYAKLKDLKFWDKNPRSITEDGLKRLKKQLLSLPQYKPLLVTVDGVVIGGNMRLRAMKELAKTSYKKRFENVYISVIKPKSENQIMENALIDLATLIKKL